MQRELSIETWSSLNRDNDVGFYLFEKRNVTTYRYKQ